MSTVTLTRVKFTDRGDQCWAVKDDRGAAEFRVITSTETPCPITLHSPHPMPGWGPGECDLTPGGRCWADCSFVAGRDLYRAWIDEGRDDEVIWGALEAWHADHLQAAGEQR